MMTNEFIIPKDLITKIKFDLDSSLFDIQKQVLLQFDDDEIELFKFCEEWFTELLNCSGFIKTNIGQYLGLFPISINKEKLKVYFSVDHICKSDWKDWFLEDKDTPATHNYRFYIEKEKY